MNIEITKKAYKQLLKIEKKDRETLLTFIVSFESYANFFDLKAEKLKGHANHYKLRKGNYRIVIEKISNKTIEVLAISHRRDIYNRLISILF